MEKYKFVKEFEFRASPKVLYPFISTPSGLQQWFAAKVNILPDHSYDFVWDGESHVAKVTSQRLNKVARYDFVNPPQVGNYVEFKLETSELDNTTYLKITDYSTNSDEEDLTDLWTDLVDKIKDIVGG